MVYPDKIAYTRNGSLAAAYSVVFHSSENGHTGYGPRADVMSSARGGFDVHTTELLDEVEVRQEQVPGSPVTIRRYHLFYKAGAFGRSLLDSVGLYTANPVQSDPTVGRLSVHTFDYSTVTIVG